MTARSTIVSRVIPKEELCLMEHVPEPCGIVIFGASGDLTRRKLIPSLFKLAQDHVLPKNYYVLGLARTQMTDDAFRDLIAGGLGAVGTSEERTAFLKHCVYRSGNYDDASTYTMLRLTLTELDKTFAVSGGHIFYLSTPPSLYQTIATQMGGMGLMAPQPKGGWVRVVIEKPFGHDLVSAQELNRTLHEVLHEDQIYRIDHYLGKETVQNILMFRFANAIFEPVWNNKYIDHIQITAAEAVGVEHRAGYYEQAGAVRDMFQNHLFQLMSLVAMEPPTSLEAAALRDEKAKVLASLRPLEPSELSEAAVRGQYGPGTIDGESIAAYRKEPGISPGSTTETFAALRLTVDNWRWRGVPFYLRSGKRLPRRTTEIIVQFKPVPSSIFKPLMVDQLSPNILSLHIQPNEGISLRFEAKHPGPKLCMSSVTMEFNYEEAFNTPPPEAYTRLFLDVMLGDQTLFARNDWVDLSWSYLDPLLDYWVKQKDKGLCFYTAGSWGPPESDALLTRDGRSWIHC